MAWYLEIGINFQYSTSVSNCYYNYVLHVTPLLIHGANQHPKAKAGCHKDYHNVVNDLHQGLLWKVEGIILFWLETYSFLVNSSVGTTRCGIQPGIS